MRQQGYRFITVFLIVLIVLLLPPAVYSVSSDWTAQDTTRELIWLGLQTIDWAQTRQIAKHPFRELNPLLGKHPSVGKVDTYMLATTVGHIVVSYLLPRIIEKPGKSGLLWGLLFVL